MSIGLHLRLLRYPRRSLHELGPLLVPGVNDCLDGSQALLEDLVFLNQLFALSLQFICDESFIPFEGLEVLFASVRGANLARAGTAETRVKGLAQFDDLHRMFVANAGYLAHVCVLQQGVHLSEEIIEKQGSRLASLCHLHDLVPVGLNDVENLRWQAFVIQVCSIVASLLIRHCAAVL